MNTGDFNNGILFKCKKKVTSKALQENSSLKLFPKGTLSIAMYGATIGKVCIIQFDATTNQACCNIVEGKIFDNKFLMYWFIGHKPHIVNLSYGGGQPNISQDVIKSLFVPCPIKSEQTAIANFLDYKTAKIDRFIRKKKQLIKLLNEQKAGIINHAVTRGLDPDAKLKDSGIEWLGDIPEHWGVKPLRNLVSLNDETLSEKTSPDYEIRYIDIGNVNSDGVVAEIVNYKFKDAPSRAKRIVKNGDVIISTVRTYLKAITQIKNDTDNLIVSTGFAVLRPRKLIISDFLNFAVRSNYFIETICSNSYGVSYPAINASQIMHFKIALPTENEQTEIVAYIEKETSQLNQLIQTIEKEIALTQEYRTALIAEAVTGKIDVRAFVIPIVSTQEELYEEIEEELDMVAEDAESYENE